MKLLLQIGLLVLSTFLGFVAGGMIGAQFVPGDSGLAGGATVFLWALGVSAAALVGVAFAVGRLSLRALRMSVAAALLLTGLTLAWIVSRAAASA